MTSELTIIVPVYNEENNLLRVEHALLNFIKVSKASASILFINDGSTDNSQNIIEQICSRQPLFYSMSLSKNCGLSKVLITGFDSINSRLIGYIDADLQTTPDDFNLLLEHIKDHDLVTGVRVNRKDTTLKRIISKIANNARRIITKDGMQDTGCPLKIIKADYAKRIPYFEGVHRFLPAMVLLQNGSVKQVPIQHFNRTEGKSNFGLCNRFFVSIKSCYHYLQIKRNYTKPSKLKNV